MPLTVITFFAGLYYSSPQRVTPLIVVGAVAFIVSTYGFAGMLGHADKAAARQRTECDETFAAYRLLSAYRWWPGTGRAVLSPRCRSSSPR
ncbi:hypothetical protein AB5J62_23410 [Amycolatopsis sp. cg5]|uniref:hypothetical protein n=1 Tax=Amycolatopsis sp. cg5 TaxID=3238802 RepID=UPI00352668DB